MFRVRARNESSEVGCFQSCSRPNNYWFDGHARQRMSPQPSAPRVVFAWASVTPKAKGKGPRFVTIMKKLSLRALSAAAAMSS
jgi:hypothetical protein